MTFQTTLNVKVILSKKQEELFLNSITITNSRIQQLLVDFEAVTLGKNVVEDFPSISITYDWSASTLQSSTSNVLKEELQKEMKNMGAQFGSMWRDLQAWKPFDVELDDKLCALKLHKKSFSSLMIDLKEKNSETICRASNKHGK